MFIYKILKKPFFGRFMVKWQNPITEAQQREWIPLEVKSKSGGMLKALFASSKNGEEKATIVLGHPMGKEAKAYFIKNGYTDLLRHNGYNTLIFDMNGFGESSHGSFSYFEDIVTISQEAKKLTPHVPIGYHGISLGGMWSTIAFADTQHHYNFAIVESAATTLDEFWIKIPPAYVMLRLLGWMMPRYGRKIKMIDRIKEAQHLESLLLIYSHADEWTPASMGERYRQNSPVPTELWTVDRAAHAAIMKSDHREEYSKKILAFFDSAVKR